MEEYDNTASSNEAKANRGGARAGAGRKKIYQSTFDFKRLKCKRELADLARTCILLLDSLSDKERNAISSVNMDGTASEYKGSASKYWADHDSFSTSWNIRINGETDFRIFALAYLFEAPSHVIIEWFNPSMLTVQLRWQRADEVGRLMMTYGNLMARKTRLKITEQEMLGKIPYNVTEILFYLSDNKALNYNTNE